MRCNTNLFVGMIVAPNISIILYGKPTNTGERMVYLQWTKSAGGDRGSVRRKSLRQSIHPRCWKGVRPEYARVKGNDRHPNSRFFNALLNDIVQKGERILLTAMTEGVDLSWYDFKVKMWGLKHEKSFAEIHKELFERKFKQGIEGSTLTKMETQLAKLLQFTSKNLRIGHVTEKLVLDYEGWLRHTKGNKDSTIYKSLAYIKEVFDFGIKKGYSKGSPFEDIILFRGDFHPVYLTFAEFNAVVSLHGSGSLKPEWQETLRVFLFATYTGRAYSEMVELDHSTIHMMHGMPCIDYRRGKTDEKYFVPIVPDAAKLIDLGPKKGPVFRMKADQVLNRQLKSILGIMGSKKNVTFHTARHTFGHLASYFGISQEVASWVLGHGGDGRTTAHYYHIDHKRVVEEMEKFK